MEVKTVDADGHDNVVHRDTWVQQGAYPDAVGSKLHKAQLNDQEVHIHKNQSTAKPSWDQGKDCKQGRADGFEECMPGNSDAGIPEGETVFLP